MLCPHSAPAHRVAPPAGRRWLGLLVGACLAAQASANAPASLNGQEELALKMRQWIANTQNVPLEQVQAAAMDHRIKVEACQAGLQFDHPFANRQTVRARCEQPAWQHYLQVSLRNTSAVSAATPSPHGLVMRPVLVATGLLKRGTLLQPGMLKVTEVAMSPSETSPIKDERDLINMELVRDLPANTPLRSYDIKPSVLVKRGQQVLVSIGEGRGFLISVRAEAMQDGLIGEQIRLKNTESGRSLSAVVTGVNAAKGL